MDSFVADVRYALRSLRLSPSYTLIAVLCLALGIGTNTTIYSAVNAMILRPLAFTQPDRIIRVYETNAKFGINESSVALQSLADFAAQATTIEGIAGYGDRDMALGGHSESEQSQHVKAEMVSWNLFSLLGIQPALGRSFTEGESLFGRHRVALISDKLWRETYSADRGILGKSILLDGTPHLVVGVMPPGMRFPETRDVWTPISVATMPVRTQRDLDVLARLKPGVTLAQANSELATIAARIAREHPKTNEGAGARAIPFQDALADEYRGARSRSSACRTSCSSAVRASARPRAPWASSRSTGTRVRPSASPCNWVGPRSTPSRSRTACRSGTV